MSNFIFLDTNIFLHYEDFDRINWLQILDVTAATIVIPPVTIRELNKQKDTSPKTRVKNRAASTIRKLFAWFEAGSTATLSEGVNVLLEDRDPLIDFEQFQLSRQIQDDHLIASALMCKLHRNEIVTIVTSDLGLTLVAKANRLQINTKKLDDSYKLPLEPDPDRLRIKELEQELREIRFTQPRIFLTFEDGKEYKKFKLVPATQGMQGASAPKISEIKQRYPKLEIESDTRADGAKIPGAVSDLARFTMDLHVLDPADIIAYNDELDEFYESYADYLKQKAKFEDFKAQTITLGIWIVNEGTAPAEDIDVFMHFPDGFSLVGEDQFPSEPEPPKPPSKPKTRAEKLISPFPFARIPDISSLTRLPQGVGLPPNVTTPQIKRSKSYDVNIHVRRLKHNLRERFDDMYLIFLSADARKSFHIDYQILAANLPHAKTGSLHVIVEDEIVAGS